MFAHNYLILFITAWLPGFARVPYYAPTTKPLFPTSGGVNFLYRFSRQLIKFPGLLKF